LGSVRLRYEPGGQQHHDEEAPDQNDASVAHGFAREQATCRAKRPMILHATVGGPTADI
jgi:hypothetical protein